MMLFLLLAASTSVSGCVAIEHDRILGKDLALAAPALAALAPDSDWGPAPLPGSTRAFPLRELKRIAVASHMQADVRSDVCFVWATNPLSPEALIEAMKKALAPRNVKIDLVEQSLWPAPRGEISFPLSSLSLGANGSVLWRGYVSYAGTRRFDIWARARIAVKENHLLTTEKIAAGRPLSALHIRTEPYEGALTREEPMTSAEDALGLIAKFDLAPGTLLTRRLLDLPHDVERGGTVTVVAESGHAHVEAQCIADESGRAGDIIPVHNARSGRHFRALLETRGKAVVASGDGLGLIAEDKTR
jgi:flagella basal body P-ring formation protein FlgA